MYCRVVIKKKSLYDFGVVLNYPDFYYRSILYIDNVKPIFNFAKSYFSSLDEAESFCNFVVMNSSKYRNGAKCEANESFAFPFKCQSAVKICFNVKKIASSILFIWAWLFDERSNYLST